MFHLSAPVAIPSEAMSRRAEESFAATLFGMPWPSFGTHHDFFVEREICSAPSSSILNSHTNDEHRRGASILLRKKPTYIVELQ